MTNEQKSTINQILNRIERANGKQTCSVHDIKSGHITLWIGNVRDRVDFVRTTTYCDVEINTKGNVTKGFSSYLYPKVETKYPYIN